MVCGACRARSSFSPCKTVVEVPVGSVVAYPDYRDTRLVLRSRFHAALNARGLSPGVENILKEQASALVVCLHMPLTEPGTYLTDGDQVARGSWWPLRGGGGFGAGGCSGR